MGTLLPVLEIAPPPCASQHRGCAHCWNCVVMSCENYSAKRFVYILQKMMADCCFYGIFCHKFSFPFRYREPPLWGALLMARMTYKGVDCSRQRTLTSSYLLAITASRCCILSFVFFLLTVFFLGAQNGSFFFLPLIAKLRGYRIVFATLIFTLSLLLFLFFFK